METNYCKSVLPIMIIFSFNRNPKVREFSGFWGRKILHLATEFGNAKLVASLLPQAQDIVATGKHYEQNYSEKKHL